MTDCIFCKIAAGEIPADIIYEDEDVLVFRDLNPQAPVHVLIIPRRHIATLNDLQQEDAELIGKMSLVAKTVAEQGRDCPGRLSHRVQLQCRCGADRVSYSHAYARGEANELAAGLNCCQSSGNAGVS